MASPEGEQYSHESLEVHSKGMSTVRYEMTAIKFKTRKLKNKLRILVSNLGKYYLSLLISNITTHTHTNTYLLYPSTYE